MGSLFLEKVLKLITNLFLLLTLTVSAVCAQEGPLVQILTKHWETSKQFTLAVAEAMPEADYSFKASPAEMSFGELMNHIAKADALYCSNAIGSPNPFTGSMENSKASAQKNLNTAFDLCLGGLQKMNDADLMKMVGTGSHQVTAFERFWGAFTHTAHHRGQAEVYLRLKGIKPPDYTF